MIKEVTRILLFIAVAMNLVLSQDLPAGESQFENGNEPSVQPEGIYLNGNGVDEARNRLPQLLRDVKNASH